MWDFPGNQWLRLCASIAGGVGSIPGWGTKILHGVWHGAYPPSKIKTPKTWVIWLSFLTQDWFLVFYKYFRKRVNYTTVILALKMLLVTLMFIITLILMAQRLKRLPPMQDTQVRSLGWKIPWRRKWQPTPVFLPGESHGGRGLVDCSPRGHKESDTTEWLYVLT